MTKFSCSSIVFLLIIFFLCSLVTCQRAGEEKKEPEVSEIPEEKVTPRETTVEFAITEPEDSSQVDRNVVTVKGVGAQPGASIVLEVFTDTWYLQDGEYEIDSDGSWTYAPCHLKGRGSFRFHHNIRAKLIKNGDVTARSTIYDVTAPEPTN